MANTRICTRCGALKTEEDYGEPSIVGGKAYPQRICKQCKSNAHRVLRGVRIKLGICVTCGGPRGVKRLTCDKCTKAYDSRVTRRKLELKIEALKYKGWACAGCGLKTDMVQVYDFHHLEPKDKDECISRMIAKFYTLEEMRPELDKCIVLCANCHREHHEQEEVFNYGIDLEEEFQKAKAFLVRKKLRSVDNAA